VAFLRADFLPRSTAEVAQRTQAAVAALRRAGVAVEEERLPFDLDDLHAAHRIIVRAEAAAYHHRAYLAAPDQYGPDIGNNVASGLMIPAVHYLQACRLRARFIRSMDALLQHYDMTVFPSTLDVAPAADVSTGDPLFCEPFSHTGHPAITLPLGRSDGGLPIGIQLGASRLGDAGLLARARWCEAELGWRAEVARPPRADGDRP
jgi:aspartyl-tRNA(Asn)/glutamyl-tRNA(Gln) amidotransferase subunit A